MMCYYLNVHFQGRRVNEEIVVIEVWYADPWGSATPDQGVLYILLVFLSWDSTYALMNVLQNPFNCNNDITVQIMLAVQRNIIPPCIIFIIITNRA
jgi:hypothetical protein